MFENIRIPRAGWIGIQIALILWISWGLAGLVNGWIISKASSRFQDRARPGSLSLPVDVVSSYDDYSMIIRRNIFNSAAADSQDSMDSGQYSGEDYESGSAPHTTLNLKLMRTLIWGAVRLAVIQLSPSEEKSFRLNDQVSGAKIVEIDRNRVALLNNGRLEILEVGYEGKPAPGGVVGQFVPRDPSSSAIEDVSFTGDGAMISKRYMEGQLKNMNQLLTQVRAVPNMDGAGNTNGFKLFAIQKGSVFEKIGLTNNDVVEKVNGVDLNSAEKGLELFQALRNESNFNVDIMRGNQKMTLRYNIQ